MVIMKRWFILLLVSTIAVAADEEEREAFLPHYKMEHDAYREKIIGTHICRTPTYDRHIWVIRSLKDGAITTQGLISPKDDPQNSTKYTPSDEMVRLLIKKMNAYELQMAIANSDKVSDKAYDNEVYYHWLDNVVTAWEVFITPRYFCYIKADQELDGTNKLIVSGSISLSDTFKTVFFEPSEQKRSMLQGKINDFLKRKCCIKRDAQGKVELLINRSIYQEGDQVVTEVLYHTPRRLSIRERCLHDLKIRKVHHETIAHYNNGNLDYVVHNPFNIPAELLEKKSSSEMIFALNISFGKTYEWLHYDRYQDAIVATATFAERDSIRIVKGVQSLDKESALQLSGFLYLLEKIEVIPYDPLEEEVATVKAKISDFLKKCTVIHDGQGKFKKFVIEYMHQENAQLIAEQTKHRRGACVTRSKLIKDLTTNTYTVSGDADLPDAILTVAYVPSEKDIAALKANMEKYITKRNESQVRAIEQECQTYLDKYMENVVKMAEIVQRGDDRYTVVEGDEESSIDLNSNEKKDESIEVVLSLLKNYIDLKKEAVVEF